MSRWMKWTALTLTGGVLLQISGCAAQIAQFALSTLLTQILRAVLGGVTDLFTGTTTA